MINRYLVIAALAAMLAGCATGQQAGVPEVLSPDADERLVLVAAAKGVQIYECRARSGGAVGYEWVFKAPEAGLADRRGNSLGLHGAGPYWQAPDGSRITGTVRQRADAPVRGAIPWLLLSARADAQPGILRDVTSVQRINTAGGMAPESGCDASAAGALARVPYLADYYFFAVPPRNSASAR